MLIEKRGLFIKKKNPMEGEEDLPSNSFNFPYIRLIPQLMSV